MDLFVVPTISFRLLYGFLVLRHSRREILWLGVPPENAVRTAWQYERELAHSRSRCLP
jgi:hypothetical protein